MEEIWKPVVGYEGLYEVSSLGNLKICARTGIDKIGKRVTTKEQKKSTITDKGGYLRARLSKGVIHKTVLAHRLVAQAFIPNPLNKKQVNHKNGIRSDNRVENLEWVSNRENVLHGFRINGRKGAGAKPVLCLNNNQIYGSTLEAAKALNILNNARHVGNVANGKRKTVKGYRFRFIVP